jgi:CAAX prenyl protease-like protein
LEIRGTIGTANAELSARAREIKEHPLLKPVSSLASRYRWLPFVLPLAVYLLLGQLEPRPREQVVAELQKSSGSELQPAPDRPSPRLLHSYPVFYSLRILVTAGTVLVFLPTYLSFPFRIHPLSVAVGTVGIIVWVGLCQLDWESTFLRSIGQTSLGVRPGFDPITALEKSPAFLLAFLAIRFTGLVCIVPLIEEFFLRGFILRFFVDDNWQNVPVGTATPLTVAVGAAYGVLSHPAEAIAAACWFSLVTWWVWKRRNIWDAVATHAVTNLLLGIYVLVWKDWALW